MSFMIRASWTMGLAVFASAGCSPPPPVISGNASLDVKLMSGATHASSALAFGGSVTQLGETTGQVTVNLYEFSGLECDTGASPVLTLTFGPLASEGTPVPLGTIPIEPATGTVLQELSVVVTGAPQDGPFPEALSGSVVVGASSKSQIQGTFSGTFSTGNTVEEPISGSFDAFACSSL